MKTTRWAWVGIVCAACAACGPHGRSAQTGPNGYDDVMKAAARINASPAFKAVQQYEAEHDLAPMAMKRRAVNANLRALALIRKALEKPIRVPRRLDQGAMVASFPEFARLREATRLLAMEEEVQLDSGYLADAIHTMETCVRLGQAWQQAKGMSALVGMAIVSIGTRPVVKSLGKLPVNTLAWLGMETAKLARHRPDYASIFEGEYLDMEVTFLHPERERAALVGQLDRALPGASRVVLPERTMAKPPTAAERNQILVALAALRSLDAAFAREAVKLRWLRKLPEARVIPEAGELRDVAVDARKTGTIMLDAFDRESAILKLLSVHAAVLARRSALGAVPASLESLRLGDTAIDPFSGKLFVYRPSGTTYRLYSVGPDGKDDGGVPMDKNDKGDVFLNKDGSR